MADLGGRDEIGKKEDEFAKWAVGWDTSDDAIFIAARREYVKLSMMKINKLKLLERKEMGGRKRKQARPQGPR